MRLSVRYVNISLILVLALSWSVVMAEDSRPPCRNFQDRLEEKNRSLDNIEQDMVEIISLCGKVIGLVSPASHSDNMDKSIPSEKAILDANSSDMSANAADMINRSLHNTNFKNTGTPLALPVNTLQPESSFKPAIDEKEGE